MSFGSKVFGAKLSQFIGRFGRLGIVAGFSFVANTLLTVLITEWGKLSPELALAIVLVFIFAVNFLLTRYWVFGDRIAESNLWDHLVKCLMVSGIFRLLECLSFALLLRFLDVSYLVLLVCILIISFVIKGVIYDRLVFR